MTAERIAYFEKVLSKPQPEPHGAWLKELLEAATGKAKHVAVMVHQDGSQTELGTVKPDAVKIQGKRATVDEAKRLLDSSSKTLYNPPKPDSDDNE